MTRILGQGGRSISDQWDVEGSIVGVGELATDEVFLVQEMGGVMLSERLGGRIQRETTGDILQSITWGGIITAAELNLPGVTRILGVSCITNNSARIGRAGIYARDNGLLSGTAQEFPLFTWDSDDLQISINMVDDGNATANLTELRQIGPVQTIPSLLFGAAQRSQVSEIAFRGVTTAFGAGTVEVVALIYLGVTVVGGLSSFGLPVPSW